MLLSRNFYYTHHPYILFHFYEMIFTLVYIHSVADVSSIIAGVIVGVGFLIMCVIFPTVVACCICYRIKRKSHHIRTTPATLSTSNALVAPAMYPSQTYTTTPVVIQPISNRQQTTPIVNEYSLQPVYPQQQQQQNFVQPVYRDAEITSSLQEAPPPSYDVAISYMPQVHIHIYPCPLFRGRPLSITLLFIRLYCAKTFSKNICAIELLVIGIYDAITLDALLELIIFNCRVVLRKSLFQPLFLLPQLLHLIM